MYGDGHVTKRNGAQAGGAAAAAVVEPRRAARDPERTHQGAPGARVDGDGAAAVVPAAAGAGAHRPRDAASGAHPGHVLQTGGLLGAAHRPLARPRRQLHQGNARFVAESSIQVDPSSFPLHRDWKR